MLLETLNEAVDRVIIPRRLAFDTCDLKELALSPWRPAAVDAGEDTASYRSRCRGATRTEGKQRSVEYAQFKLER